MTKKLKPNYELLRDAYAIIDGIPPRKIDLDAIQESKGESLTCGTICCAAGWLALHPQFQALGLNMTHDPAHFFHPRAWVTFNGNDHDGDYAAVMSRVFRITDDEAVELFGCAGESPYDHSMRRNATDKSLFLNRVRSFLKEKGQPCSL